MTEKNYALLWANGLGFHDLMRLHAHDLAEKIRDTPMPEDKDDYAYFRENGAEWAANLIDPEVDK